MDEILELHKQGLKIQQIADTLDMPLSTAHYKLKKAIKNEVNEVNIHSNTNFQMIENNFEKIENGLKVIENDFEKTPKVLKNEDFTEKPTHIKYILERELLGISESMEKKQEEIYGHQNYIYHNHSPELLDLEKKEMELEKKIDFFRDALKLNDVEFYNLFYPNDKITQQEIDKPSLIFIWSEKNKKFSDSKNKREQFYKELNIKKNELDNISLLIKNKKDLIHQTEKRIKQLQIECRELEKTKRVAISTHSKTKIKKIDIDLVETEKNLELEQATEKPIIMKGKTLAYKTFETPIKLVSENLKNFIVFLGAITREMFFCSITGDAGAGKSEFSFFITKILTQNKFKVLYLSLEMGICAEQQKRLLYWKINEEYFSICDKMQINQLKEVANDYDVIIIDSFGKLNADTKEIDKLRQDFPKILFFAIFQKTTAGTMRGGSGTLFDSTMNINLSIENGNRKAKMVKSRYGTQDMSYIIPTIKK